MTTSRTSLPTTKAELKELADFIMARIQSLLGQGQTVKQVLVTYINGTPVGQFRRGLLRRLQTSVEVKYDALFTGKGVSDFNLNQINDPAAEPSVSDWVLCIQWLEDLNLTILMRCYINCLFM